MISTDPPLPSKATSAVEGMTTTGPPVRVARDYFARCKEEMSVFTDDQLEVLDDSDEFWWLLKESKSGLIGYVPRPFLQTVDEREAESNAFKNTAIDVPSSLKKPAASGGPNKRVSFSEAVQHLVEKIEYDSEGDETLPSASGEEDDDAGRDGEEDERFGLAKQSSFIESTLIDEAVRKALGIGPDAQERGAAFADAPLANTPLANALPADPLSADASFEDVVHIETARKAQAEAIFPNGDRCSSVERLELPPRDPEKPSLWTRMWGKEPLAAEPNAGLIRIFSGNFQAVNTYKTCILDEDASLYELEALAKRLYRIDEDSPDYCLSLVHTTSLHAIPLSDQLSLGIATEIAKVCTIEDGCQLDAKGKPCGRHHKKVPRPHLLAIKKRKQNVNMRGIKDGFTQAPGLERHKKSDFPTNYRFVLNMKVAPYVRSPFFVWVELESGNEAEQLASRIAVAAKALTTVEDIRERAIGSMDIAALDGVAYDLVLQLQPAFLYQYRFDPLDGREVLTQEMTLSDIHGQWPHIDPSGFLFVLRPVVQVGSVSSR